MQESYNLNFIQASIIVQICDDKKVKAVGIVKINLGTFIEEQSVAASSINLKTMPLEKCPDKTATVEFSLKTTLVSANASGQDNLSQMSDVQSNYDSGPESEFDFEDFLEEGKNDSRSALDRIRNKINGGGSQTRKPATILKTSIKQSNDPTKPPLMVGKQHPLGGADYGLDSE